MLKSKAMLVVDVRQLAFICETMSELSENETYIRVDGFQLVRSETSVRVCLVGTSLNDKISIGRQS